jgi:uncharacterized protein
MDYQKAVTGLVEVRTSDIEGRGGFATAHIPKGEYLIEYVGEKISKEESARRCSLGNNFIFHLSDEFDLDGSIEENIARFINHSCNPNAEAELDDDKVWIVALRDIAPGEEITFNYGYDLEDYRDHPCRCGAANCVGFILAEEHWDALRQPVERQVSS